MADVTERLAAPLADRYRIKAPATAMSHARERLSLPRSSMARPDDDGRFRCGATTAAGAARGSGALVGRKRQLGRIGAREDGQEKRRDRAAQQGS
jgi:hypothetical protein